MKNKFLIQMMIVTDNLHLLKESDQDHVDYQNERKRCADDLLRNYHTRQAAVKLMVDQELTLHDSFMTLIASGDFEG